MFPKGIFSSRRLRACERGPRQLVSIQPVVQQERQRPPPLRRSRARSRQGCRRPRSRPSSSRGPGRRHLQQPPVRRPSRPRGDDPQPPARGHQGQRRLRAHDERVQTNSRPHPAPPAASFSFLLLRQQQRQQGEALALHTLLRPLPRRGDAEARQVCLAEVKGLEEDHFR